MYHQQLNLQHTNCHLFESIHQVLGKFRLTDGHVALLHSSCTVLCSPTLMLGS